MRWSRIIWFGVVLALCLPVAVMAQDDEGTPVIVFYSTRDDNIDIYLLDLNTMTQYRLTTDPAGDSFPSLSPDGTQVAFQSNRSGNWQIHLLSLESGEIAQLTEGDNHYYPQWSPDGDLLAYSSIQPDATQIVVREMSTDDERIITTTEGNSYLPHWSEFGEEIVFAESGNLSTIHVDTLETTLLSIPGTNWHSDPDWSPDGRYVLYTSGVSSNDDLFIYNLSNDEIVQITDQAFDEIDPTWSPDGKQIAFVGDPNDDSDYNLYVMTRNGGDITELTSGNDDRAPSWGVLRVPLTNLARVVED